MRVANLTEIHPRLYISDLDYACAHHAEYHRVVSLSASRELPPITQLPSTRYPIEDAFSGTSQSDLEDLRLLEHAAEYALRQLVFGKVLLHCGAGENRAAAVAVVLARRLGLLSETAIDVITSAKKEADPTWETLSNARLRRISTGGGACS